MLEATPNNGDLHSDTPSDTSLVATGAYSRALALLEPKAFAATPQAVEELADVVGDLGDASAASVYLRGALLVRLKAGNLWRLKWPELSWHGFLAVLAIKPRRAAYLAFVYSRANELGLPPARCAEIGWRKCSRLLLVANPETVEEWAEFAQEAPVPEVDRRVQKARAEKRADVPAPEEPGDVLVTFAVKMSLEQRENVLEALDAARMVAGKPVSDGELLDLIAISFMAGHLDSRKQALSWVSKQVSRAFRVRVTTEG